MAKFLSSQPGLPKRVLMLVHQHQHLFGSNAGTCMVDFELVKFKVQPHSYPHYQPAHRPPQPSLAPNASWQHSTTTFSLAPQREPAAPYHHHHHLMHPNVNRQHPTTTSLTPQHELAAP